MKTPREVYAAYTIMPSLQLHQLRVAAVGKLICDNFENPVNAHDVILACLFHDMGNIVKFDLTLYPDLLEPEGLEYWRGKQREFVQKYGTSAHAASVAIAQEIGLSDSVVSIIDRVGFSEMERTAQGDSRELQVVAYADCRVATHGVVSLEDRFDEAIGRYTHRYQTVEDASAAYAGYKKIGLEIERKILSETSITSNDIHDASVAPLVEELWEYPLA